MSIFQHLERHWRRIHCHALILFLSFFGAAPLAVASLTVSFEDEAIPANLRALSLEQLMRVKIVTATQVESDPFDLPFVVKAYDAKDYQRRLPRSLPQWLTEVPGVMVQKTANGQASPFIRGFTGFRTLFLVDGIRLNNSTFRDGPNQYWNTVDPLSVRRLEIVKGPASVLYGSDAVSGTVNALTVGPDDQARREWHGRALVRASSAESSHLERGELTGPLGDRTRLFLGATSQMFGDLRGGREVGRQLHTSYDETDFDAKLEHDLRSNVKLTFAHQEVRQDDVWRTHSTVHGLRWEGLSSGSDLQRSADQHRQLTYAQLHATDRPGVIEQLHVSISRQVQHEQQFRLRANRRSDHAETDVTTLGTTVQFHSPSPLGRLVYGADFYRDQIDSASVRRRADGTLESVDVQGPVADDAIYELAGVYIQDQLQPRGPVDLTIRGRYDQARVRADRVFDPRTGATTLAGNWDSVVGSGRVSYRGGPHWKIFAGGSQGFRAPNLSDLSRLDTAASGQIETPSTDVSPERYFMSEVGLKAGFDTLQFEAACFSTLIDGMITRTPTGRIIDGLREVTKRNSGDGHIQGVELQGRWHLDRAWSVEAGFTYMDGEISVYPGTASTSPVREPPSRLMPMTGQLALHFEPPGRPFWLSLVCVGAARQDKLSTADRLDTERIPPGGTPGYTVWTVRGGWRLHSRFTASAAIENLGNEDYRIHGSGVNEPGRNVIVAGTLEF